MVSIIIKEWTTKIELVPTVQKRNAAVLLRKPGRLAPQYATIRYLPDYEIVDILASCAKMINDVNIIHYFIIRQLLDETIDFHLFRPGCQKFEGSS